MSGRPGVRYLHHASLRVRTGDTEILIDPVDPGLSADVVCISHSHDDHFCRSALSTFPRSTVVVVPRISNPWTRRGSGALERFERFAGEKDRDPERYGSLLEEAVRELEERTDAFRSDAVSIQLDRFRLLRDSWQRMNPEMRRRLLDSMDLGSEDPPSYTPPKFRGSSDRMSNPDLGAAVRELGFTKVIELPLWGEYRHGSTAVTHVPANLAHGVTEQATYLVECPSFTMFDAVDALEDAAVHSYLGRNRTIDVAFLPVTGRTFLSGTPWEYRHTMDVEGAARAAGWLDARCVVPFRDEIDSSDGRPGLKSILSRCRILEPGEEWHPEPAATVPSRSGEAPSRTPAILPTEGELDMLQDLMAVNRSVGEKFGTEHFSLFLYSLVRMQRPRTVVELGTALGVTAFWMAKALKENGEGRLWTIDDGRAFRSGTLLRRACAALRSTRIGDVPVASQHEWYSAFQRQLELEGVVTFLESRIDLEEPGHFDRYPFHGTAVDLLFSDFGHAPETVLSIVAQFLPRMAPASSILIHSASTFWPSYLLLEQVVRQLDEGRIPDSIAGRVPEESLERIRNRRYRLVHLTEQKPSAQNGAAWIKIEPVDVVPHPRVPMRQ